MDLRAFVFGLWVKGGESVTTLVTLLKTAASDQSSLITDGGRVILSSSVNGKSNSYSFAPGMSPMQVQSMAYEAWRRVKDFNATDLDEFLTYEMPRMSYAAFGQRSDAQPLS